MRVARCSRSCFNNLDHGLTGGKYLLLQLGVCVWGGWRTMPASILLRRVGHTHYLLGTHTCSKTSSTVMQLVPFGYSYGSATDVQKWASPVM